jgi:indole-3-glycerol phosphate synthase
VREKASRQENPVAEFSGVVPSFRAALRRDFVAVIAEIKRASPSAGALRPDLDAGHQAAAFERAGARAVSVLTEPTRFGGSLADIEAVREASRLPILKKDFHSSPEHLLQARALGASAALLIVRAVPPTILRESIAAAREAGLELLVEVHREGELELALDSGATIIGVNARNLETLEIDRRIHFRLIPKIPSSVIAVAESGMSTRLDVRQVSETGADAVLIGSELSRAADVEPVLRSLATVTRRADVRPD